MQSEQQANSHVMTEQDFIKLATACRPEDRAGLLDQIRATVKARRVEHRQ